MSRVSAWRGTWVPNRRQYVTLACDGYVSIQGQTSVVVCGECRRELDVNRYLTSFSTEGNVDSPPGGATVNLSIPDNEINDFYVDGELAIVEMMEIALFAKGYYTVGGYPQYYRIFWGMVSSVQKSWSNGQTNITINCKDMLRWWELTNVNINPAFLDANLSQAGFQLFQNKFAGANPYTVIIALAREAMGDFSLTTGSFLSFRPELGAENQVIAQYAKDIMAYWQLKFGNIWNNLVLYGTSGQAYTFTGSPANVSPVQVSREIFIAENQNLSLNSETSLFKIQPHEIAAFKVEVPRAGEVDFFQSEVQSKLSIALTARDQAGGYELYCDSTGDIVFKPPFYNLNVMPNKPLSWIHDHEIIDESITSSEQEVYTHVTSSGNAFGGVTDWGLNDEITTPRTGVIDWHLLKRYGWRRLDVQVEWAGNARRLFYHLLDHIDKVNSKRVSGTITIPLRPEIRMGFPVWVPKYDSFFYVTGVSHNYAPGGQATTTLTLTAKRSKFIAPKNIGFIVPSGSRPVTVTDPNTKKKETRNEDTYTITFPSDVGATVGLTNTGQESDFGGPAVIRDPRTGKLLGFPNAVMVYRQSLEGQILARILEQGGSKKASAPKKQDKKKAEGTEFSYQRVIGDVFTQLQSSRRAELIDRLRTHRYEAGMTNAGAYDYAHDSKGVFKEFAVLPADRITWGEGLGPDANKQMATAIKTGEDIAIKSQLSDADVVRLQKEREEALSLFKEAKRSLAEIKKELDEAVKKSPPGPNGEVSEEVEELEGFHAAAVREIERQSTRVKDAEAAVASARASGSVKKLKSINVMIRPVSDEFGFEVIGHYRYGRGAFIDRGQVQILSPNEPDARAVANQVNIQFAASGGLITDNPRLDNLGPEVVDQAAAFEKMQPDDYRTGATFRGGNYSSGDRLQDVNPTGQQTYDDALNTSVTKAGKAVYVESDALRRAVTLAELKPTTANGLDDVYGADNKCACALGRASWLTVLPSNLIQQVLSPADSGGQPSEGIVFDVDSGTFVASDGAEGEPGSILLQGNFFALANPGGFYQILTNFLRQRFEADYGENMERETYDVTGGRSPLRLDEDLTEPDVLGDQRNALFDRASLGDPEALAALAAGANFNFGLTEQAVEDFKDEFGDGALNEQLEDALTGLSGLFLPPDVATAVAIAEGDSPINVPSPGPGGNLGSPPPNEGEEPQYQPPGRMPRLGEPINLTVTPGSTLRGT